MKIDILNKRSDKVTHLLRVMSPLGFYPDKTIIINDNVLYISKEICFSIVPYDNAVDEKFRMESEVRWLNNNEIKFYSSILLSIDQYQGTCTIYPFHIMHYIEVEDTNMIHSNLRLVALELIEAIRTYKISTINKLVHHNPYLLEPKMLLPYSESNVEYGLFNHYDYEVMYKLQSSIDINDSLMIRGLSLLLRSKMLILHQNFMEDGINTTFISMEVTFRLILRILSTNGIKNPSSKDASKFIAKVFKSEMQNKYFEEYYESRVKSLHPESRYGVFAHPPLQVDDHCDLVMDLIEVYRYVICGFILPKE